MATTEKRIMDDDNSGGSDSDSFVVVSDAGSVGSDSESYVIVRVANHVGTDSGEECDESEKRLKKILDYEYHVGNDSEDDLSDDSKQQLKNVDDDSYLSADSEESLADEIKRKLKNVDNDSYVSTDSEEDQSDGSVEQFKNVDNGSFVGTGSEEDLSDERKPQMKNVDNDSYVSTGFIEDLSYASGGQLKIVDTVLNIAANVNQVDPVCSGAKSKIKNCTFKFHVCPYKRIGRVEDPYKFPYDKYPYKKIDINDVTMEHVLPFLPAKSLCRLRTVSKEWDQWIGSFFFIHKQSHYFRDISGLFCQVPGDEPFFISLDHNAYGIPAPALSFLPEPVTLRTSCNGLLCCESCDGENTYYICNPANKRWKKLPKSEYYHGSESYLALAFETSALDFAANFELVCAFSVTDHFGVYFDVYSSTSDKWNISETVCYELEAVQLTGNGFFLKGVAYWETLSGHILAFDLKEKQYSMLLLPLSNGAEGVMTEMNGELCYILPHEEDSQYTLGFYGGMDMKLKQMIYLVGETFYHVTGQVRALAWVKNEVVLILVGRMLIAYHVKTGQFEVLSGYEAGTGTGYAKYLPYVNSLVKI